MIDLFFLGLLIGIPAVAALLTYLTWTYAVPVLAKVLHDLFS